MNLKTSLFVLIITVSSQPGFCENMEDLMSQFGQAYEAAKPEKNSSINTDYKLEQAALGTYYSTKALNLIYEQNKDLTNKYEQMAERYNEIVEQNKEMIRLLKIISEKK